ncbi:MAG: TIGR03621 family F420-dependent LLM class oxidoreductase [Actinomycetota bacterium]|nr:TIGR03621 family F420-dependent LLM class oxidoreductase [Actinomycetota bacterium]
MAHARRFRFGIQVHGASSGKEWADMARRAEDLGYATLVMPDHFGDQIAPVPGLMAAADATTTLRIGTLVFDNDYKHPVVLAKEVASLDVLSGGRVELGIGAGWMSSDYEQSGIPEDRAAVRVDRMEEGIAVLKGLFAEGACTFAGEHYRISGLDGMPKPVQSPHPPILIGGGKRRVLQIAGREADIVGINPTMPNGAADADAARTGLAAETDKKLEWIREGAGERFEDLEINLLTFACMVTDDREDLIDKVAPAFGLSPPDVASFPHALIGSIDQICETLEGRRERWHASYIVVQQDAMESMAPVVARLAGG